VVGRTVAVAICLAVGSTACGGESAPASIEAEATGEVQRDQVPSWREVPQEAQASFCSAAGILAAVPEQPSPVADANLRRAADELKRARDQIPGTSTAEKATSARLAALISTTRLASIAIATGDDAGRREHEATIAEMLAREVECA
jgi:hypothetical protein